MFAKYLSKNQSIFISIFTLISYKNTHCFLRLMVNNKETDNFVYAGLV